MSHNDDAIQRLVAAQGLMQQDLATSIAQAGSQISIAMQYMLAATAVITDVDGHTQQAIGQSAITSFLVTLNTTCERIIDELQSLESSFGQAATESGQVVNEIHARIQSLMAAGG